MKNLLDDYRCDEVILQELKEAGVPTLELPACLQHRVPSKFLGILIRDGGVAFRLHRRSHRWEVVGDVPLDVAQALYLEGGVGKREIRAGGDCACRPPEEHVDWRDDQGHRLSKPEVKEKYAAVMLDHPDIFDGFVFVEDPPAVGHGFVTLYHIDSQEGLNLFVKTLREHGIVD